MSGALHAVVSDIHGNLEALDVVLADLDRRGVSSIACLGDFVGYGASPNACLDRLRPRIEAAVVGNHDVAAIGMLKLGGFQNDAAVAARWTGDQLAPEHRAWLEALPDTVVWRGMRLVHSAPLAPREWQYVLSTADAQEEMKGYAEQVCLIGHSHFPGAFVQSHDRLAYTRQETIQVEPGHRYLVNVSSVGQPRDGDPRAGYLLVDEAAGTLTHVRLPYPVDAAARRIVEAGLPGFLAERLKWGE